MNRKMNEKSKKWGKINGKKKIKIKKKWKKLEKS